MSAPKPSDREFKDEVLSSVEVHDDGYTLHFGGFGLGCPKGPIVPMAGMTARLYGRGFGYTVRGIVIDGAVFRYQTAAEEERVRKTDQENREREKREKYERDKPQIEARIAALPEPLRKRFNRFQKANPDFGWDFGDYELYCCEEAVKIHAHFKGDAAAIQAWSSMKDYEAQKKILPVDDGHSGNTFGMACRLAWWLASNPENATREHGALVGLVGCKDYGCEHTESTK